MSSIENKSSEHGETITQPGSLNSSESLVFPEFAAHVNESTRDFIEYMYLRYISDKYEVAWHKVHTVIVDIDNIDDEKIISMVVHEFNCPKINNYEGSNDDGFHEYLSMYGVIGLFGKYDSIEKFTKDLIGRCGIYARFIKLAQLLIKHNIAFRIMQDSGGSGFAWGCRNTIEQFPNCIGVIGWYTQCFDDDQRFNILSNSAEDIDVDNGNHSESIINIVEPLLKEVGLMHSNVRPLYYHDSCRWPVYCMI